MASRSLTGVLFWTEVERRDILTFYNQCEQSWLSLGKFKNLCPNLVDGDVKFFQYFHKTQKRFDFILCLLEGEISRGQSRSQKMSKDQKATIENNFLY